MLESGKIGSRQFTILVMIYCLGSAVLFIPTILANESKQDSWIAALIGLGAGLLLIYAYRALGEQFPDQTLFQYCEILFGKWLGKGISLFFILYFYLLSAVLLRDIGDFITTQVLPETPIQFTEILFLIVVVMGVRLGLEVIAHSAELFFPWILGMFLFLVVFLTPQIKIENILPIYESGLKPILSGGYQFLLFPYVETVVFLVLYPYVKRNPQARNAHLAGALLGGIVLIILTVLAILVMGVDLTSRNLYVTYTLAKRVSIGHFLERVEAIMATVWLMTIFFKLSLLFYSSTLGLAHVLNLKEYRPLIMPLGFLLVIVSLKIEPNIVYLLTDFTKIWPPIVLTTGLFLPLLMLALAKWHNRKNKKGANNKNKPQSHEPTQDESA